MLITRRAAAATSRVCTYVFPWAQLVCLLPLLAASVAQAQSPALASSPRWLAQELLWASSVVVVAQPSAASLAPSKVVTLPSADFLPPADAARQPSSLGRQRGRYRTMKVAGYTLAATALALGLASIPLHMMRHDHESYYGRGSCAPNFFPYVGAAALGAGLTVGATGSLRDLQLTRKHGSVAPSRSVWRSVLAGLGVATAMSMVASSLVSTSFCNS